MIDQIGLLLDPDLTVSCFNCALAHRSSMSFLPIGGLVCICGWGASEKYARTIALNIAGLSFSPESDRARVAAHAAGRICPSESVAAGQLARKGPGFGASFDPRGLGKTAIANACRGKPRHQSVDPYNGRHGRVPRLTLCAAPHGSPADCWRRSRSQAATRSSASASAADR